MDSIGEKLKSIRESRKLSISEVAKDTNISALYIEALENEDFDRFPSETYAIGFLRNYAEYLRLDADEIIQSYKGYKIGESATPLEELTRPTGGMPSLKMPNIQNAGKGIYVIGGIVAIVLLVFLIAKMTSNGVDTSAEGTVEEIKNAYTSNNTGQKFDKVINLKITDDKGVDLASSGEAVQFLVDTKEFYFLVKKFVGNSVQIETYPDKKEYTLNLEQPVKLPYAGTAREVTVTLKALTEDRGKFMVQLSPAVGGTPAVGEAQAQAPVETQTADTTRVVAQDERNLKIIFEAEFLEKTYLDLYLDGQRRKTGIMMPSPKQTWEANNTIQLKIGNAGGVKVHINGKEFVFGGKGQVANKIIKWEKDPANPNVFTISVKDWR